MADDCQCGGPLYDGVLLSDPIIAVLSPGEGRRTNRTSPPLLCIDTISCSPRPGWIIQFHPASSSKSGRPIAITRGPSRMEREAGPSAQMMSCHVASTHSTDRHLRSTAFGLSWMDLFSSRMVWADSSMWHLQAV